MKCIMYIISLVLFSNLNIVAACIYDYSNKICIFIIYKFLNKIIQIFYLYNLHNIFFHNRS